MNKNDIHIDNNGAESEKGKQQSLENTFILILLSEFTFFYKH